ncbi:hypothetical protein F9C07_166 [Aspergillus flavus]|uniref:Uncharacterized protein n=1 Tax=Aspergillus flavus (strain ATCC 200026 / FGSC A1120 / IAM 13836 / NRRL 3357 / JCM 12722 / SRRC 167) TaxID=332952 RepID=A0A7U2QWT3_ASPFN|nr:hypothetical protein AFLA70_122g002310 [Aspergillus flavus AF70]QRD87177.1 hypothetical protein F9C07_166 [Aspergillus flavus]
MAAGFYSATTIAMISRTASDTFEAVGWENSLAGRLQSNLIRNGEWPCFFRYLRQSMDYQERQSICHRILPSLEEVSISILRARLTYDLVNSFILSYSLMG